MNDPGLILAFFSERDDATKALRRLRRMGFSRVVLIHKTLQGKIHVEQQEISDGLGAVWGGLAGFALTTAFPALRIARAVPTLVGAATGYGLSRSLNQTVRESLVERYKKSLTAGEVLILVEAPITRLSRALAILRADDRVRPTTFIERISHLRAEDDTNGGGLLREADTIERLMQRARELAQRHQPQKERSYNPVLLRRLRENARVIDAVHNNLVEASRLEQPVSLSAEWLLDNSYVIRGQINEVRRSLTRAFYRELPVVETAPITMAGRETPRVLLPRVYALARELISHTDNRLDRANLQAFISAYQEVSPLSIAELWALPLMLRLALIENLRRLFVQTDRRQRDRERADFWANRLLNAARREPDQVLHFLSALSAEQKNVRSHFADRLVSLLYDEGGVLEHVRSWLERKLDASFSEIIAFEQRRQASDQISVSNAIGSQRFLNQLNWNDLFEELSVVATELCKDPAGIYPQMDFDTRDLYRREVERIARKSPLDEQEVAKEVVALAHEKGEEGLSLLKHIGYYLVDDGFRDLERQVKYTPPLKLQVQRTILERPLLFYLGAIGTITLGGAALLTAAARRGAFGLSGTLGAAALLPMSEIGSQVVNAVATRCIKPRALPKMNFEEGIPDEWRCLVVVPMMLGSLEGIQSDIENLEVHYLANTDPALRFALLSDYTDAPEAHLPQDQELLDAAQRGIENLNARYPDESSGEKRPRFFLFHRERRWCESEGCWMGWERKRGKLEQLNAWLLGEGGDNLDELHLVNQDRSTLEGIRFVLTLDADAQLPHEAARHLIEAMAHPLNRPYAGEPILSENGQGTAMQQALPQRGYSVIMPRVSSTLPSATATRFSRLFTAAAGTDPYTHVSSDLYQDLFKESSYQGKGIYDVEVFHRALDRRFPESRILSHDLLEGAYVRVGLASDVEILDQFPPNYETYSRREHRWIRGDWQIANWVGNSIPTPSGTEKNPLSLLNRWKIADNLRRSLLSPAAVGVLLYGWSLGARSARAASTLVGVAAFTPLLLQVAQQITGWKWGGQETREFVRVAQRCLVQTALIPHQAQLALDAIGRVIYRRRISKKLLLEWQTASATYDSAHERETSFLLKMAGGTALVLAASSALIWRARTAPFALPFMALWASAPLITKWLHTEVQRETEVSPEDRQYLRRVARRTWRYFDDFVGPQTNWLPPDNYQEMLNVELAQRTSPTNIGLWLQSALAAFDFGYLPADDAVKRMLPTLRTFDDLEKFNGHLLNWYNVQTLESLRPRYVSTVDSGNLLGSLVTVEQGVMEILDAPLLDCKAMRGLQDTLATLREVLPENSAARNVIAHLENLFDCQSTEPVEIGRRLHVALPAVEQLLLLVADIVSDSAEKKKVRSNRRIAENPRDLEQAIFDPRMEVSEAVYWAAQLEQTLRAWVHVADRYTQWLDLLAAQPEEWFHPLGTDARARRKELLKQAPSLNQMARGDVPALTELLEMRSRRGLPTALLAWLEELAAEFGRSRWLAGEMIASAEELLDRTRKTIDEMDMAFLYDSKRKLFPVGFNLEDMRVDSSFYDLLASECRIASFLAIARGDVPVEHWWSLGRRYGKGEDQSVVLLSWSGTMFEYLMPALYARGNEQSLLDVACRDAIEQQILYARRQNIPWGISEAAFSDLDANRVYQYKAFGVPSLALQRGHDGDVVVAPYATLLALPHALDASLKNLKKLQALGAYGGYGFYESIDFSREHLGDDPEIDYAVVQTKELWNARRGVIVRAYMAHHQGMAFLAMDNLLHRRETEEGEIGIMQARFHADAFVRAATPLLYERVPPVPAVLDKATMELAPERLPVPAGSGSGATSRFYSPDSLIPRTHLLSNGRYSIMLTNAGGGYSRWCSGDVQYDISRWRADTTTDERGSFIFVRDTETNAIWSTTHQPLRRAARMASVEYKPERVEYRRRETEIETITDVFVAPEDDCEIRRLTLINHSSRPRTVEITSYVELALNEHAADRAHPAFSKLFVQTESLPQESALLANRRLRSEDDLPIWAMHMIAEAGDWELALSDDAGVQSTSHNGAGPNQNGVAAASPVYRPVSKGFEFETDRAQFIGRGRSLSNPRALRESLSNTAGAVLDPVFALRRKLYIGPNQRVQISFVTGAGTTREEMIHLIKKYSETGAVSRSLELAWTHAQLEMHHLRIRPDETQLFQQMAGGVLYPHVAFRAPAARLRKNTLGQSTLWSYGISGDLPIFVVIVDHERDLPAVRQTLLAHTFWHLHGLKCDLVILNQQAGGYHQELTDQLQKLAGNFAQYVGIDTPGGIFIRAHETMPEEHLTLLLAAAHIVMVASRGRLAQQLSNLPGAPPHAPRLIVAQRPAEEVSAELPFLELPYFNGYGGFTPDGREYAIYLGPGDRTPAPWINVMANPVFGQIASEAGQGFSWWGNSQENRMTGWSNDPVSDPINDAIYIRDDDTGTYWTPTAGPIREKDAYRTRHGQGYTIYEHNSHAIEQELLTFVPVSQSDMGEVKTEGEAGQPEPIRIQRLRLRNSSTRRRRLTITGYHEWVLGTDREETQLHVVTSWDTATRTLLAHNAYHPNYGTRVAFSTSSPAPEHFTADRTAFLGRNGKRSAPAVLRRKHLTDRVGAGLDPCAATQFYLELAPGESTEVFFMMGQGADVEEVRSLVRKYRDPIAVEAALEATKAAWDGMLGTLEIETPIRSINFLLNRWLMYQNLSCRVWGRSAFYQSGGAWGFRDQLQDVMALVYTMPHIVRAQILRAAAHQFEEGDVQHWWHEPSGAGVRTRITDDLLFLPYVVEHYIRVTGDISVLDEEVHFLHAPPLEEGEHEKYFQPDTTSYTASIYEHCVRAIEHGSTRGQHGLPLIGAGDWNDGLNAVGQKGKGESVWLAWFLIDVLEGFADTIEEREKDYADKLRARAKRYAKAVEKNGWDGEWYRRAYYDDGAPLGSKKSDEGKIDVLPQAWAAISGAGDPDRTTQALASADKQLVKYDEKMVLLFKPPFDKTDHNPGYIKGYLPGVRENGGQYTHGALWLTLAYAMRGEGDKAVEILQLLNPVEHALNRSEAGVYKVEPYAVAADVYSLEGHVGRGGWTWYTGSAAWMYRVWVEAVLGFQPRVDKLYIKPAIPTDWKEYSLRYRHGGSVYDIKVVNPEGVSSEVLSIEVDGQLITEEFIPLTDEEKTYQVLVTMGKGEVTSGN